MRSNHPTRNFFDHARSEYGTDGVLAVDYPTEFRGMTNPGTATPNTEITGRASGPG